MLLRDRSKQIASDAAALEAAYLRQQVAELREAVRTRNDFIAIAAHKLRNPMTPNMAAAEIALKPRIVPQAPGLRGGVCWDTTPVEFWQRSSGHSEFRPCRLGEQPL